MKTKVTANVEAVAGLTVRLDTVHTLVAGLQGVWEDDVGVKEGDVKEEDVTEVGDLPPGYMTGQQRILASIEQRNKAMDQT